MANDAQAGFDNFVQLWTTGTTAGRRAPVLRRPDEVGWTIRTSPSPRWTVCR